MERRHGIAAVAAPFGRDVDACLSAVQRIVAEARSRGAGMVVLPESALGGYLREDGAADLLPPALELDGPELVRLAQIAGDTVVCAGFTEALPDGGVASAAVCVTGDGILGHHRKVHLPPAERFAFTAGTGFAAFDTPVGRVGMLLCYDKLFPEAARTLVTDGAEIVASLAAWPADRHRPAPGIAADRQTRHFDAIDVARAVENQVVWVSANQSGDWGPLRFLGRARVVDPDGRVLAETGHRGGIALTQIDPAAAIADTKLFIDHLADRRPAAYGAMGAAEALGVPLPG